MRKHVKLLLAASLMAGLLIPNLAAAKPSRSNCNLGSQEYVYVQLNIGHKIANLQGDLLRWNVRNQAVLDAMSNLAVAYDGVYKDSGKYGASHDTLKYTESKLEALRDAAANYYAVYLRNLNNDATHGKDALALQELTALAVEEFASQCDNSRRSGNNWQDKWNRIDNGGTAYDVLGRQVGNSTGTTVTYQTTTTGGNGNTVTYQTTTSNGTTTVTRTESSGVYVAPSMAQPPAPNYGGGHQGHMPPPHHGHFGPQPMDDSQFNGVLNSYMNEHFTSDQLKVLDRVIDSGNLFTVDQTMTLMRKQTFDSDKIKVAVKMYPAVYDKQNWYKVYDLFDFNSDKKKLEEQINAIK